MQTVTVIGFDGALGSAITGIIDLFRLAGVTWARINNEEPTPKFTTRLLTFDGQPFRCINGITLLPDGALTDPAAKPAENSLVMIPTIGAPIPRVLNENRGLVDWLAQSSQQNNGQVRLASNCTGAFLLAEAGLLDGREATTHWGFSEQFRQRYPKVDLHPEKLITVDEPVACAGGGMAWWDLGIYLVERYAGAQTARELAKAFVVDAGRTSQAPYSALQARRYHSDTAIMQLQEWLDQHYSQPVTLQTLAALSGLTERSLIRRFKAATGDTPTSYLQVLRIESARQFLEQSKLSVDEITRRIGYEDVSSFSRLFSKHTGLAPGAYRSRFGL
ncbi:GlxA family transcriptional regulator [Marinobacter confluentis]|uniref:Helix-turn-helix domain-containing protein n=1 Tax=Marinobacter confluentis TaxID=1697557 RepID=A0A4Z1BSB9_9GAMM|nr:helix-turn-helix domain-containing protein [Marinobacter confluentis]TGN40119.1 helix-turn-helix domain-containing protein [Marinobacter confluentis]